jgi:hypothetical protein
MGQGLQEMLKVTDEALVPVATAQLVHLPC